MSEIFEKAARTKLRFNYRGVVSVEDLWDLAVEELDALYKSLSVQVRQANEESLLKTRTKADDILSIKVEIIKHIVAVKLQENEDRKAAADRRARKERLLEILQKKQDEELLAQPSEELQKLIDGLG